MVDVEAAHGQDEIGASDPSGQFCGYPQGLDVGIPVPIAEPVQGVDGVGAGVLEVLVDELDERLVSMTRNGGVLRAVANRQPIVGGSTGRFHVRLDPTAVGHREHCTTPSP